MPLLSPANKNKRNLQDASLAKGTADLSLNVLFEAEPSSTFTPKIKGRLLLSEGEPSLRGDG